MTDEPNRRRMVQVDQWMECCTRCGALVGDRDLHEAFHDRVVEDPWAGFDPMDLWVTEAGDAAGNRTVVVKHFPTGIGAVGNGKTVHQARRACREHLVGMLAERNGGPS